MQNSTLKKTSLLLLALLFCGVAEAKSDKDLKRPAPFKFDEYVTFLSVTDSPWLAVPELNDFTGVLIREDHEADDRQTLNLYHFKKAKMENLTEASCLQLVPRVYGASYKDYWKISAPVLFNGGSGKICEVVLQRHDPTLSIQENRLYVIKVENKFFGLMAKQFKPADEAQAAQFREFVRGLRKKSN